MKVWITTNLFTVGIQEKQAKLNSSCHESCVVTVDGAFYMNEGRDWHRTKESAIARAEKMRSMKVAAVKRQMARLEAMRFE